MPQISEIRVEYGRTIRTDDVKYEFKKVSVELSAKILPGEPSQEAVEDLYHMAKKKVDEFLFGKKEIQAEDREESAEDYF